MSFASTVNPSIPIRGSSSGTGRTPSAYSQFFASEEFCGCDPFSPFRGSYSGTIFEAVGSFILWEVFFRQVRAPLDRV